MKIADEIHLFKGKLCQNFINRTTYECFSHINQVHSGYAPCTLKHESCAKCCKQKKMHNMLVKLFIKCDQEGQKLSKLAFSRSSAGGLAITTPQYRNHYSLICSNMQVICNTAIDSHFR